MNRLLGRLALALVILFTIAPSRHAAAAERLCDSAFQDCRAPLISLIRNERIGIDVAFWFMEDQRYSAELIARSNAGVPVRVIMDTQANAGYPGNVPVLNALRNAGIPMLEKTSGGIVHWKTMIFAGQNTVQFSGANYSPHAFVPTIPYVNYLDEVIYFSDDPAIVNSFKTKYDEVWTTTSGYTPYANLSGTRTRRYPVFPIDPQLTFVPTSNFAARSVDKYNRETQAIDTIMFRITDKRHTDALIAAMTRGVPFRLITDYDEYRDPTRLWHAYNVDRLYMAGAQVKFEGHEGILHQKSTLLRSQRMTIFGSSNWTSPSATSQLEHNIFTTKTLLYNWFSDQFDRKWNNETGHQETMAFVPSRPDPPQYVQPANAAQGQPLTVTLKWNAGVWAHKYDIYFGTTPTPPLLIGDVELGPSETPTDYVTYNVTGLQQGVTYYWKIVSRTMANVTRNGQVWNFRTIGSMPTGGDGDVVLYAARAGVRRGRWQAVSDSTAAGGARMATADGGVKVSASASPADYFEASFNAAAGVPYRLWLRGKAQGNAWANDSAFAQFSDSVTSGGAATYRIGTTSATSVTIENCSGCGLSAWGWNDNATGVGVLGPQIFFATSGEHRIRIQMREDGLSLDQIVLSRNAFLSQAPGATKNDGTILQEAGGTSDTPPVTPTLPAGWQSQDIGAVGGGGTASESGGIFTVKGAGADIWGTADAFHYAYRTLSGDGTIVARVASIGGAQAWSKVGVMIRASTSASAASAFMLVSTSKGLAFQRRTASGGQTTSTMGPSGTAPRWVRLSRAGNVITAATSANGSTWTTVGSDTFTLGSSALVGLAVSSHTTSSTATGTFDQVSVSTSTMTTALPAGWSADDVGAVGEAGSTTAADGSFVLRGAGADVWGRSDAFHFAHRALSGDGEIVARIAGIAGTESWTKMGVMIRSSLDSHAAYAFMLVSKTKGLAFQRRTADGGAATSTSGGAGSAPRWVKLAREGDIITASSSTNGSSWTVVGSDVVTMDGDVLMGLAASSHDPNTLAQGTFESVATE